MHELQKTDSSLASDQREEETDARDEGRREQRPKTENAKRRIASEQDCLAALSQLPALVTMGLVDIKQANAYKGIYSVILQHYHKKQTGADRPTLDQPGLADLLRKNPDLANLLEPLLSLDQIEALMRQGDDGADSNGAR